MSKLIRGRAITIGVAGIALLASAAAYFLLSQRPEKAFSSPTDVDIAADTTWSGNQTIFGTLTVKASKTLTINSSSVPPVTITTTNLIIESGAKIIADGQGSAGGAGGVDGVGTGKGLKGDAGKSGGGAGYGGAGGDGAGNTGSGGASYGVDDFPFDNGSGGGGGATAAGGAGGGAIKFIVSGTTTLSGPISANGADGSGATNGSGAGSGGSIYLDTNVLTGSGNISANGGSAAADSGGAGAGGRIAIYSNDKTNFTGTVSAVKGATGSGTAADGTTSPNGLFTGGLSGTGPLGVFPNGLFTGGSSGVGPLGVGYYFASSTVFVWSGEGGDNLASTALNWLGDTAPTVGSSVIFNDSSSKNCTWNITAAMLDFNLDAGYTGAVTLGANLTLTNNLTLAYGTLSGSSYTISVAGNWVNSGGAFTYGTSTAALTGSGTTTIFGNNTFYNLTSSAAGKAINFEAGKTVTVANNLSLAGASGNLLTLSSTIAGTAANLNVAGSASNMNYLSVKDSNASGGKGIIAYNSTSVSGNTNWIFGTAGAVYWTNGSGDGKWSTASNWSGGVVPTSTDSVYFNNASISNCTVDAAASVANLTLDTGYTGTVTLAANLILTGNLTLAAGTLSGSSYTISVAGNWSLAGGAFTAGTSTVEFTGIGGTSIISGANTFYNLTCRSAKTLNFTAGLTQAITGTLTLDGPVLRSVTDGSVYTVNATGTVSVKNVDIKNCTATTAFTATQSTDSTGNTNITFDTTGAIRTWTGTTSTDWDVATNWSDGATFSAPGVADSGSRVVINVAGGNQPVITNARTIASLDLGQTAVSTLTFNSLNTLTVTGNVHIWPTGTITHTLNTTSELYKVNLIAGSMTIDSGGKIDVNGKGYNGSFGPGKGIHDTKGGGYGGQGSSCDSAYGNTYGSITQPINLGSGSYNAGGGAIKLNVTGTFTHNGSITSQGAYSCSSGGSIWITANTLSGTTGSIQANGDSSTRAGGGGRIALYYTTKNYTGTVTAYGGVVSTYYGAAGTIYEKPSSQTYGDLRVDNNNIDATVYTYLSNSKDPANVLRFNSIKAKNKAHIFVGANISADSYLTETNGTIEKWLDATKLNAAPTVWWIGATSTDWNTGTNWSGGSVPINTDKVVIEGCVDLTYSPAIGISGVNTTVSALGIGNGSTFTINAPFDEVNNYRLITTGNACIVPGGNITHAANATTEVNRLNLDVGGNMVISSSGSINVGAKGYYISGSYGAGPGRGYHDTKGAGYGGQGESRDSTYGNTYGSITQPINLGSSGWGPGGGAIKLNVIGTFTHNGIITSYGDYSCASGGSIWITANTLSGTTGSIQANGATSSGAGGGGRIALYYTTKNYTGTITAYGAVTGHISAAGTIYEKPSTMTNGILTIDNYNRAATTTYTTLGDLEAKSYTFDSIIIKNKGMLRIGADDSLTLASSGTFSNQDVNSTFTIDSGGVFTNNGTFALSTTTAVSALANSGTFTNAAGSTFKYVGTAADDAVSVLTLTYKDLELDNAGTTFTAAGNLTAGSNFKITNGTFNLNAKIMNVGANFTNLGTFTHANGTVILDTTATSAVTGTNTFYNLTCTTPAKTINFDSAGTQTVGNILTLVGSDTDHIIVGATAAPTKAGLIVSGPTPSIWYVTPSYSNASGGNAIMAGSSTDGENNLNWVFGEGNFIWDGGGTTNNWSEAANWNRDIVPPADSNVYFNSTSTKACTVDQAVSLKNFSLAVGYTGTVTLSPTIGQNLVVSETIRVDAGLLVDNGRTVSFKNCYIANTSTRLTSTGIWKQAASGEISNPSVDNVFISYEVAANMTGTLSGQVYTKQLVLGASSTITGSSYLNLYNPAVDNFIVQGSGAVISPSYLQLTLNTSRSQGALATAVNTRVYYRDSPNYTLSMGGNWNIGGALLSIYGTDSSTLPAVLDTNGYNLILGGDLQLGLDPGVANTGKRTGKILFKSGTHTIGGKIYTDGQYAYGYFDLGAANISVAGNVDFRYSNVVVGTSTVNLTVAGASSSLYACTDGAGINTIPFYSLTSSAKTKTVKFEAGKTATIAGIMAFTGQSGFGEKISLRSTTDGTAWNLNVSGGASNMNYLDVKNSDASSGNSVVTLNSTNDATAPANVNWIFSTNASDIYWTNASGDNKWSTLNNWSGGAVPTSSSNVYFNTTSIANCTVDAAVSVVNLTLDTGYTGTVTLANTLSTTANFTITQGTFDAATYAVTVGGNLVSSGSLTRSLKLGTGTWSVAGNWDTTTGSNITINPGTSTVSLTGTGTLKTAGGVDTFYNLTCAASTKTTTLDVTSTSIESQIKNVLTLGGGTLTKTGTNSAVLALTNGSANATPLVLGATTIGSVVTLKFMPSAANTINIAGGNYTGAVIDAYAKVSGITFQLADSITGSGGFNVYADNNIASTVNLVDKNLSSGYLKFGSSNPGGSVTFNAGSGAVTFTTTAGLSVNNNAGTHTLNMGSSTWTVLKDWNLTNGTGAITANPQTSTVILSGSDAAAISGNNSFNNLRCLTAGKALTFEADKTQAVSGTLTFTGADSNLIALTSSTAGTPWQLNVSGAATGMKYLNVKDSNATGKIIVAPASTIDAYSLAHNWVSGSAGAVYWTNSSGDNKWSTAANWSTGIVPISTDAVYFSSVSTSNCTVDQNVTVAKIATLSGYGGTIDFGANTISVAGDCDLSYATITLGTSVINITANNATFSYPTDLTLNSNNGLNMTGASGQTVVLPGSLTVTTGSNFTAGTSTVKFTATSGTKVIDMIYSPASPTLNKFYNLTFDGAGGTWQYKPTGSQQALQVDYNFTLANGTFDNSSTGTNKNITILHDLISSGSGTRVIQFGTSTTWAIGGSVNLSGANLTANFGASAITAGANWDSSGTNTFTVGTSTVNLNGIGTFKAAVGIETFYNLTCAASTKTTTLDVTSASIEPQIKNVLTLGAGTLTKTGSNSPALALTKIASGSGATPLVLGNANTGSGVIIKFIPSGAGTVNIAGGNYNLGVLDAYAKVDGVTFKLADSITGSGGINLYADDAKTTTVDLNNKNFSGGYLKFGKSTNTGSVTVNAGTGAVTFTGTPGLSLNNNAGAHTLNLNSSTWTLLGNWLLTSGTGSLTVVPQTSTVIFSSANDSYVYGDNTFYNLKCAAAGKHLYFEDTKIQTVNGNIIFAGASDNKLLLSNISQVNPWKLNSQGQATVVYVNAYNSDAMLGVGNEIVAAGSTDGGNNTNWAFTGVGTVYWTGTGTDNNWSNPDNWSVVAVPGSTDDVVFNGGSVKDCVIDTAANVKSLTLSAGYTGTMTLGADLTTVNNLVVTQGNFNAVTFAVSAGGNFSATGALTRAITMGSGSWNVGGNWDTSGSNLTLTPATAVLTMSGNTFTMSMADIAFNSLTFSGTTSASLTCSGNFNPTSFTSTTIKPSITFTSGAAGNIFNPRGVSFNNVTFSGAAGEWTLQDNLAATGTITVSAGKLIDNAKSVSFKSVSIANAADRLTSTGAWSQTDSGTITNANISNKFKQLTVAASSKTTTLGSDITADTITFSTGTFKGENYTLSLLGVTNPIVTDSATAFTAGSRLAALKLSGVQSQGLMHLGSNLVTDAVEFYRSTGAIQATGNWDCGNNTVRFYADAAAIGKAALTNGANNYNLTAGVVQLGSASAADAPAYLNLGSGTHSIGNFAKAYSGTATGILSIEMAAAAITDYSGNFDLTPFTYTCGTSTINFIASSGLKTITTNNKALYSLVFNGVNTQWQLVDDLTLKGSITLTNGALLANSKNLILIGQDIALINGNFTTANNSAFYDFTCSSTTGKQIKFAAGKTVAVTHEFNITGVSASRIKLLSITQGSQWSLDAAVANVLLAEVRDSIASPAVTATRCIDSDNNTGWVFSPTRAWDGGGNTNNWSEAANWEDNAVPTSNENVIFDTTSTKSCVVNEAVAVKDITLDTGYSGTVSIGAAGSITSEGAITLNAGVLNDSGKAVSFQKLVIADTAGLLVSTGTWTQSVSGTVSSPNASNKINSLVICGTSNTTTLLSDLQVNVITFGDGIFKGEQYTLHLYGDTNFITAGAFTVSTTLSTIKIHDCLSQGAFQLPNDLTSTPIDWWYKTTGASATGNWNFGNNKVRFYTNSGASGSVKMLTYNLTAGDMQLGSVAAANNNVILELGSGTHSIKSLAKAYAGPATGALKLFMGSSTLNCTGDINFTNIEVTEGTSALNLIGTLAQTLTTINNAFSTVNFSGSGPFNISADFTAASITVTEAKAINCSGSFVITQGITPATSTVSLIATGSGNQISLPAGNSFYNLTIDGVNGAWALASAIGVSNTLTINNGALTDNAKAINFKNISIADKTGLLVSSATWTQNASGEVKCPNKESRINNLSICGANKVTTFTGDVAVNTATFGTGTLAGAAKSLYVYGTTNSIATAGTVFTVNSGFSAIYTENHTSQNAFKLPNNLVTDSIYWRADVATLAATGNWDFGDNSVTFYTTPAANKEIQLSSFALTCGSLRLGSSLDASYPAALNLGSGTKTIGSITKAYSGTTTGGLNLLGGSSTITCSGGIDFSGITFTSGTSVITMQGGSGAKTILSSGQQFYDLVLNDADTSWSLSDTLTVKRDLTRIAGTFTHNNKKVIISGANIDSNITGAFTFYDFECVTAAKKLSFSAGLVQTVQGTFTVTGASGYNIKLYSQAAPAQWYINPANSAVNYVNVKDSYAQKTIVPANSTDEGNNTGWIIGGQFTFSAPALNTVLSVGTVTSLSWVTDSGITQAKLYYATNASVGTPTWKPITVNPIAVNPNGQVTSYDWTVPDDISTDCKIKIAAVIDSVESTTLFALSPAVKIMGALNLTYPTAAGVGWPTGVSKNITWAPTGTIPGVEIYCSTTGLVPVAPDTWRKIGETATNTYYSWKPSDTYGANFSSDNCYIKIIDTRYPTLVYSISAYNFMLSTGGLDNLTVTTTGGVTKDTLISGSSYQIRWDTSGAVSLVDLSYSLGNGVTWMDIAKGVSNTDSRFDGANDSGPWVIPHNISDNVLVRVAVPPVSPAVVPKIFAQANVKIVTPFTITAPAANNIWVGDTNNIITWTNATGSVINNVKIEYTTDGSIWQEINSGTYVKTNDLSESWKCPKISTDTAAVRISDAADVTGFAYTQSAVFKLKQGNLTVRAPNTQVIWKVGEVRRIEWEKTGDITQVKLKYCVNGNSQNATWKNVVPGGAALSGSALLYDWTVPDDISDTCLISIEDATDSQINDTSDTTFSIKPNIILNLPNGGQSWVTGTSHDIVWSTTGTVPLVKLWYSINNGSGWTAITADPISNTGTKAWVIPEGAVSEDCLVKVVSSTDAASYGQSSAKFAITLASITVTAPVAGNIWVKGDINKAINWSSDGTVYNNLLIEYSALGNFSDAVEIAASQQNTGSYLWTVSSNITNSATAKIRVKDMDWAGRNYTVQGISSVFEITSPRIDIAAPLVNDRVVIGTDFAVQWAARGKDISTVKILYSPTGNFTSDVYTVVTGLTASAGTYTYSWKNGDVWKDTIPRVATSTAKIRVVDENNQTIYKDSGVFRVAGTFVITAPAVQAKFFVSKTADISWSTIGTIANVKLSYSKNGNGEDAVWYNMAGLKPGDAGYAATTITNSGIGTYTWTIPDLTPTAHSPNTNVYVKIEDPLDALAADTRKFTVTYYAVKWKVVDLAGLVGDLSALVVEDFDILANNALFERVSGLNSGAILYYYPGKKYTSVWSRDAYLETAINGWEAYADGQVKLSDGSILDTLNASTPFLVKMPQKLITKVLKVEGSNYYDANSDTLSVSGWLMQQDTMIAKNDTSSGIDGITQGYIEIFDETNNSLTTSDLAVSSILNPNGTFNVRWAGLRAAGKLVTGKNYFARLRLMYQGAYIWGVVTFQVSGALDIQAIQQSLGVKAGETIVTQLQKTLGVSGEGTETIAAKVAAVADRALSILTAAEKTIPDKITTMREEVTASIKTEVKPHVQSGILTRDTTVKQGDTIDISYRTVTGLVPTVTVYDSKDRVRLDAKVMVEVGATGVYGYKVKFLAAWGKGDFTVVCTEPANGTVDALVITVIQSNLEDVAGQVSAVVGSTSGLSGLKNVAETLNSQFNVIDSTLAKLSANIVGKVTETKDALSSLQTVFTQLESISKQIQGIGGTAEGINLEKLYNVSKDKQNDVTYIKNKTQELKAAMEINQKLMQNVANKPVVQTWFEFK